MQKLAQLKKEAENEKLMKELQGNYNYMGDFRIKFVGTVYNQQLLKKIRENAFGYFHGHTVGGTNPSLIEALSSTKLEMSCHIESCHPYSTFGIV